MKAETRLSQLARRISDKPTDAKPTPAALVQANPPHGEKGDFVKVTVTLPPAVYELLVQEATRRKVAKERDPSLSAILREAAVAYLAKEGAHDNA